MPSARDTVAPYHRKVGAALGYEGRVRHVKVRCESCASTGEEPIARGASVRGQLKEVSCLNCGRLGALTYEGDAA